MPFNMAALKNRKMIFASAAFIGVILLFSGFNLNSLGTLNFGFEGVKANFYGAYFNWDNTIWNGAQTLHKYQDAEPLLLNYKPQLGYSPLNKVTWGNFAVPNQPSIRRQTAISSIPDLTVHVENNVQLQDITRQGDPLNFNASDPTDARIINYWIKQATKTSETDTTVTYRYNVTHQKTILAPAEFWLGYYVSPSQSNAGTGSGWREGSWSNIVTWFRLDFNTWDNAYRDEWLDTDQNVFNSTYGGTLLNQEQTDNYRGGFPIVGWVQGWEKAGYTSSGSQMESPIWFDQKGKTTASLTIDQLPNVKDQLMSKVQIAPGMVGSYLSLYSEPTVDFNYKGDTHDGIDLQNNQALNNVVKSPDSTMKDVMYFPVNIMNMGTLTQGDFWNGYTVYYPSVYLRVRIIYGIYGTFNYLWTEQVTKDLAGGGLEYPDDFEREETTVIHTTGFGSNFGGISDFFSDPLIQLWIIGIILVIVVILVTWFNPGVWSLIALNRRKKA